MKNFWPLLLLLIPDQLIRAQQVQHAPTIEQCHADQRLWLSKLEEPNDAGTVNVSFGELQGQIKAKGWMTPDEERRLFESPVASVRLDRRIALL